MALLDIVVFDHPLRFGRADPMATAALLALLSGGCAGEASPLGERTSPGQVDGGAATGANGASGPGTAVTGDGTGTTGAETTATGTTGGVTPGSGTGNTAGAPAGGGVDLGECGAVSQTAENVLQPVDIIFGVDTSGSMAEEVAEVQANLNAFSQQIIDAGLDVHVIMLANLQGSGADTGGALVDGPCIAPPLGSGQCPDDSNPPTYVHLDRMVTSWDVLDVFIAAYPDYKPHLRESALKTFVAISDDDANVANSPFGALADLLGMTDLAPVPTIDSADAFIEAVANLEPGSRMWSDWRYSGIYSFTSCPSSQLGAVGTVHAELVERTGGVAGDLCLQDFAPVFDELAREVTNSVTLACDWEIPPPPDGESFDAGKTNVQVTLDGNAEHLLKVSGGRSCESREGWHYDDETDPHRVVACPSTCARLQAAQSAQVELLFGCETQVIPLL